MKFLDEAKVYVKSGNGGAGCMSFRREKYVEFGASSSAVRTAPTAAAAAA